MTSFRRILPVLAACLLVLAGGLPAAAASLTAGENGTVVDAASGLVWQARDDGVPRTWLEAKTYCETLRLAGLTGWRLPHRQELQSLLVDQGSVPLIDQTLFPGTKPLKYWTAERDEKFSNFAWALGFGSSLLGLDDLAGKNFVRCVR